MQAYGPSFAHIYNQRWAGFAQKIGPRILDYYEIHTRQPVSKTLLDLACGAGHLAAIAVDRGYQVTGIDLSEPMLSYARKNNLAAIIAGQARFLVGDVTAFSLDQPVSLVVSTFDALNHLVNFAALESCFDCVYRALEPGGLFVFDLNTRFAIERWNSITVEDTPELMLITRGIYDDAGGKGYTRISGFSLREDGLYDRFEETAYNTVFDLEPVRQALFEAGWNRVHIAAGAALDTPIENPENEGRAFFLAWKDGATH